MSSPRPRPCIVCGVRVTDGSGRCRLHKSGSGRPSPCLVCARPTQGRFCPVHEPSVDEAVRNERNPYRQAYKSAEYARNRQHRFERARGRCEACHVELLPGDWDCDHLVPLRKGGTNEIENLRILCKPCHKLKTAEDRRRRV